MTLRCSGVVRRGLLAGVLLTAVPAAAQNAAGTATSGAFGSAGHPAVVEIDQAMRRLAAIISKSPSGDLDGDLADKIIAFHQTSIDVAQVILSSAVDPQLRTLAIQSVNQESNRNRQYTNLDGE